MRVRVSLLAAALSAAVLPVVAHAAVTDCTALDVDSALCALTSAGEAVQSAEKPAVPARDAARLAADRALEAAGI